MENIKFIRNITEYVYGKRKIIGNAVYYDLCNGKLAKMWCGTHGVNVEIIGKDRGVIDSVYLPFANYFTPKQCSAGAPLWPQHIDCGEWYFHQYEHCRPTAADFRKLAEGITDYMELFGE